VAYHKRPVLYGIDLEIGAGRLVGVIGPNGAGKSTLIKTIMGLVPVSSGWIKIFGKPYRKSVRRVGYVPQRESVDWDFPVNVIDVVLMGRYGHLGLCKRIRPDDRAIARACLEKVNMLPYAGRQISNLSGGSSNGFFWRGRSPRRAIYTSWTNLLPGSTLIACFTGKSPMCPCRSSGWVWWLWPCWCIVSHEMTGKYVSILVYPWPHGQSYSVVRPPAVSGVERVKGGTCRVVQPDNWPGVMH